MTERDKLVELILEVDGKCGESGCANCDYTGKRKCFIQRIADHLLANGVTVLPCKVGDTMYTNLCVAGDYFRRKDRPYKCKVVFIGLSNAPYIHVQYENNRVFPFDFDQIGKDLFLTREEAEAALKKEAGGCG